MIAITCVHHIHVASNCRGPTTAIRATFFVMASTVFFGRNSSLFHVGIPNRKPTLLRKWHTAAAGGIGNINRTGTNSPTCTSPAPSVRPVLGAGPPRLSYSRHERRAPPRMTWPRAAPTCDPSRARASTVDRPRHKALGIPSALEPGHQRALVSPGPESYTRATLRKARGPPCTRTDSIRSLSCSSLLARF